MHGLRRDLLRIHVSQDAQGLQAGLDAGTLSARPRLAFKEPPRGALSIGCADDARPAACEARQDEDRLMPPFLKLMTRCAAISSARLGKRIGSCGMGRPWAPRTRARWP